MKVGITGASGFIGRHLVDALKKKKNVKLFYFDLPKKNLLNLSCLKKFVAEKDVIIHAAAINRGSDTEIITSSIIGTYNLISAIKNSGKRIKLIFLSSIKAEDETVFGLSKRLAEIMLRDFSQEHKTPVTIFRITNVFGEGCRPFYNSVVATFCYQAANSQKLTITDGNRKMNLIYIKDLASLLAKEVFIKHHHPLYFKKITTKNIVTIKKLARIIKAFNKTKDLAGPKNRFYKNLYQTYRSYKKS